MDRLVRYLMTQLELRSLARSRTGVVCIGAVILCGLLALVAGLATIGEGVLLVAKPRIL